MLTFEEHEMGELTRAEKVLALGLVLFLLLGGLWALRQLQELVARPDYGAIAARLGLEELRRELQLQEQELGLRDRQWRDLDLEATRLRVEYEFRREEYRTALDAGRLDPELQAAYERARGEFERAQERAQAAAAFLQRTRDPVEAARARVWQLESQVHEEYARQHRTYELKVFLLRLLYVGPVLALAVWGWHQLRSKSSQLLIIATAFMGFAVLQAVIMVTSYAWGLFRHVAQLVVSIGGSAVTIAGIVALRRYVFNPARVQRARARRGLCPRCGFSVHRDLCYCPDCGEQVSEVCSSCGKLRPVGLRVCPVCGDGR
jgi:RNA polymerase subunit RPABC4/transcription elongation factor Spt4